MPYLFTHAEHQARAMLMGMEYDWRDCTYSKKIDTMEYLYFDGETLEPMSVDDCIKRLEAWEMVDYDRPIVDVTDTPKPTPYCRE